MGFFGIPEEEALEEVEETESGQPQGRGRNKVVSLHTQKQIRVFCPSRVPTKKVRKSPTI